MRISKVCGPGEELFWNVCVERVYKMKVWVAALRFAQVSGHGLERIEAIKELHQRSNEPESDDEDFSLTDELIQPCKG